MKYPGLNQDLRSYALTDLEQAAPAVLGTGHCRAALPLGVMASAGEALEPNYTPPANLSCLPWLLCLLSQMEPMKPRSTPGLDRVQIKTVDFLL